jgi:hypothetical protein
MKKFYTALLATTWFLVLLLSIYWVHVVYFKVNVLLYSALADCVLAVIGAVFIQLTWRRLSIFNNFEKFQLAIIWLFGGYIFAISVPTVIDRSLSLYILEKIQQRGGGIQLENFEEVFTKEYLKEHRLMDVRLTEQLESGTIQIENGCIKLTERGNIIATFSRFFRENFLPKQRLLMGSYSDVLTDPFRGSVKDPDYKCH